jgi:hypothetical protein
VKVSSRAVGRSYCTSACSHRQPSFDSFCGMVTSPFYRWPAAGAGQWFPATGSREA